MSRAKALRTLQRFDIERIFTYKDGRTDWSVCRWRVRPRGFHTLLMVIDKPEYVHTDDFTDLMGAIEELSREPAPRKRRKK